MDRCPKRDLFPVLRNSDSSKLQRTIKIRNKRNPELTLLYLTTLNQYKEE